MILHKPLSAAALVCIVASLALATPAHAQWMEQIESQFQAMGGILAQDGFHPALEMLSGSSNAGATETLSITLRAGISYRILGVCDTDCSDLDLTLYSPAGREVAQDILPDDAPILDLVAEVTGTYRLEVGMVECSAEPCFYGVQTYAPGESVQDGTSAHYEGELRYGDSELPGGEYFDAYTVQLQSGDLLQVDMRSEDFDTYLVVRSPTGRDWDNDDFESSTRHSRVEVEATQSGTWEILATAYEKGLSGLYSVDVTVLGDGGSASLGGATPGGNGPRRESGTLDKDDETLSSGEYADAYTFQGRRGEAVIVDLRSNDFDPYLIVVAPDEEHAENDDYEGDMHRSLVRLTLDQDGEYRVLVTSYDPDETGAYDLSIERGRGADAGARTERGTLAPGDETLRTGEYVDEFNFEGRPGERVRVDLRSGDFDTYVMLIGPAEFREENDDAESDLGRSIIEAELNETGTYRVLVTSYEPDETGSYELTIEQDGGSVSSDQRDVSSLTLGQSSSGTLAPGDGSRETGEYRDLWVFDARAGEGMVIEMASSDFDPYLLLLSPDGDVIDENDDADGRLDLSRMEVTIRQAGRYRVVATSFAEGEVGSYQVTVRPEIVDEITYTSGAGSVYGVFVGISDYGGRAPDLDFTAQDAERAADAMVQGGGMRRQDAIVLTDREATAEGVRAAFREMGRRVGPDDLFVYFYSGHGDRVPRPGPERSDPDAMDETIELYDAPIRDDELNELFGLIDSGISLLVLDACFSGGFSKDVISEPGRMGLFSSEEDVTSQVAGKFRAGGYLAQFVFDGVGERLADADRDGGITAIELSQYLHERYRTDVKSGGPDDYVRTGGPQSGYQHLVVDRGSIGPYEIVFR